MIIVDYSGIAIAAIFSQQRPDEIEEGLIRHMILNSLRMYNVKFKQDYGQMIIACDSTSWRKEKYPQYKFKRKFKSRSTTITSSKTQPHTRCAARVWAGGNVTLDDSTKTWIYGAQCSNVKYASKPYCPLHLKVIEKHGALLHGDFFKPPPHPHFEKFKQKKI